MRNRDYTRLLAEITYVLLPVAMGAVCIALFGLTRGGIVLAGMALAAAGTAAFAVYDLRNS